MRGWRLSWWRCQGDGFEASGHNASTDRLSPYLKTQDPIPGNSVAPYGRVFYYS